MTKLKDTLKKNTMLVALIIVMALFQVLIMSAGKGSLFAPTNVANLIMQNSYVVILATGMLLCILTGGNIDLSVGSIVALIGAVAGTFIVKWEMNIYLAIVLCLVIGLLVGVWQGFWIAYVNIPPFILHPVRHADLARSGNHYSGWHRRFALPGRIPQVLYLLSARRGCQQDSHYERLAHRWRTVLRSTGRCHPVWPDAEKA